VTIVADVNAIDAMSLARLDATHVWMRAVSASIELQLRGVLIDNHLTMPPAKLCCFYVHCLLNGHLTGTKKKHACHQMLGMVALVMCFINPG